MAKEFAEFISAHGYTHVTTSEYYPQSNGKIERRHKSFKGECIHRKFLSDFDQAVGEIEMYIDCYNEVRLHSAIGYVAPRVRPEGRQGQVFAERERQLEEAPKKQIQRFADIGHNAKLTSSGEAEAGSVEAQPAWE